MGDTLGTLVGVFDGTWLFEGNEVGRFVGNLESDGADDGDGDGAGDGAIDGAWEVVGDSVNPVGLWLTVGPSVGELVGTWIVVASIVGGSVGTLESVGTCVGICVGTTPGAGGPNGRTLNVMDLVGLEAPLPFGSQNAVHETSQGPGLSKKFVAAYPPDPSV